MYKTREEMKKALEDQGYITNIEIDYAVMNAMKLGLPILIEGAPGVGKTEIAKVLAKALDTEIIRVQCYEGIDFTKVLYDYNYGKQLLYINLLKDNVTNMIEGKDFKESVGVLNEKTDFYGKDFLLERPVLRAISPENKKSKVLLIDEVDKADAEFESFLLEVLSDYTVTIPEYGVVSCGEGVRPVVVLTSNAQRELSEALKRRCVYLYIDYPTIETESIIISEKVGVEYPYAEKVAKMVKKIRDMNLKQKPSIAESITWCETLLNSMGMDVLTIEGREELDSSLNVLLKNRGDIQKVRGSKYMEV